MRRLTHISLAAVFLITALAEPAVALQATHACCRKRAAVAPAEPSCHGHHGAQAASVSEAQSAQKECPDRCCCLATARRAAHPQAAQAAAAALPLFAVARAFDLQPLSQAELPAPSGRAPPSRHSC